MSSRGVMIDFAAMQITFSFQLAMKRKISFFFYLSFWLWKVSGWSSAAHQARDRTDGVWSSYGAHNHVYGPGGDGLCSTAGSDPNH